MGRRLRGVGDALAPVGDQRDESRNLKREHCFCGLRKVRAADAEEKARGIEAREQSPIVASLRRLPRSHAQQDCHASLLIAHVGQKRSLPATYRHGIMHRRGAHT
eukprot:3868111-Pyramimonas_sp.AAC.1